MSEPQGLLQPGMLWPRLRAATEHALKVGALEPFQTEQVVLNDSGVDFLVRRVSNLERKIAETRVQKARGSGNPFLPYDENMFVVDLTATHVALLNKYPVLRNHVLIVTREYRPQETLLDLGDFEALWAAMLEFPALGFYNAGSVAGASQPHKHLQVVPLPLDSTGAAIPLESRLEHAPRTEDSARVSGLTFPHAFAWLDPARLGLPTTGAPYLLERYRALLATLGIGRVSTAGEERQSAAYNLLVTRRWMLAVPRTRERFDSVFVNALGFAGSFFVRTQAQMDVLRRLGPMRILAEVSA